MPSTTAAQVLTTFQLASTLHTLSHIRWWRIIVDEPQLNAGGFLADKDHTWFANHRWLLTGTPINANGGGRGGLAAGMLDCAAAAVQGLGVGAALCHAVLCDAVLYCL
jgi:hypothetical protein